MLLTICKFQTLELNLHESSDMLLLFTAWHLAGALHFLVARTVYIRALKGG